jgi:hypothetical protein
MTDGAEKRAAALRFLLTSDPVILSEVSFSGAEGPAFHQIAALQLQTKKTEAPQLLLNSRIPA